MLGQRVICPSEPVYTIADCRIFNATCKLFFFRFSLQFLGYLSTRALTLSISDLGKFKCKFILELAPLCVWHTMPPWHKTQFVVMFPNLGSQMKCAPFQQVFISISRPTYHQDQYSLLLCTTISPKFTVGLKHL